MILFSAALLGVIQGLTEFLPVSSTAHLLIGARVLNFSDPDGVFTVTIQFGSILALLWVYREKIFSVVRGLPSDPSARRFAVMLAIASLPAFVAGALLSSYVKAAIYTDPFKTIGFSFIVGGVVMLLAERFRPKPIVQHADETPVNRAFAIGLWQALAIIPGVSRSGATIVGGLLVGLDRAAAAEFSFFLAMPTLTGAFAHDLWKARHVLSGNLGAEIAVGLAMAFVSSLLVVRPFMNFVGRSGFAPFAWYRIAAGAALLAMVWMAR